jgi:catechol 2,3-dioxygenase-like lactoylglutathione lyase family enzyme
METLQFNHVARETSDVARLAGFYEAVLGFERVPSPACTGFQVAWLHLPNSPGFMLHIFERDPAAKPRHHHLGFTVADYDGFVTGLKARGTELFEKTQPDGRTRQVFFFNPDGKICLPTLYNCSPVHAPLNGESLIDRGCRSRRMLLSFLIIKLMESLFRFVAIG